MTDKVAVSFLHDLEVATSFMFSFFGLWQNDINRWPEHEPYWQFPGALMPMRCGTDGLADARNKVAASFLATEADWLFFVDTDMGFAPDTLDRLMASASLERPIVAGLYFAQSEAGLDGMGGYFTEARPQLYDLTDEEGCLFTARYEWPRNSIVKVDGTGSGCVLIHRTVFERVGPQPYERMKTRKGGYLQEDLSFYLRCRKLGIPVHVDTAVKCSHMKTVFVNEGVFNAEQFLKESVEKMLRAEELADVDH